jgi:hypothetical protein
MPLLGWARPGSPRRLPECSEANPPELALALLEALEADQPWLPGGVAMLERGEA